ncbi:MAG: hypothetical protein QOE68_4280, partial [Thermoanaerobaculia bacterium]|nr:hypothetical protein [Thermoanaerobaculia bacterium]
MAQTLLSVLWQDAVPGLANPRECKTAVTNLSVVIPTFNTAQMTLRCCRAVLSSLPADSEVIVADDGST